MASNYLYFRRDGLSGSVDASKGETGMFGGSIDRTVVYGADRPPAGIKLLPDDFLQNSMRKAWQAPEK